MSSALTQRLLLIVFAKVLHCAGRLIGASRVRQKVQATLNSYGHIKVKAKDVTKAYGYRPNRVIFFKEAHSAPYCQKMRKAAIHGKSPVDDPQRITII